MSWESCYFSPLMQAFQSGLEGLAARDETHRRSLLGWDDIDFEYAFHSDADAIWAAFVATREHDADAHHPGDIQEMERMIAHSDTCAGHSGMSMGHWINTLCIYNRHFWAIHSANRSPEEATIEVFAAHIRNSLKEDAHVVHQWTVDDFALLLHNPDAAQQLRGHIDGDDHLFQHTIDTMKKQAPPFRAAFVHDTVVPPHPA